MSGETGYHAYGESVGWLNHLGNPMPEWKDLPNAIRDAWDSAACAIVSEATRLNGQGTVGCACEHPAMMHDVAEASGEGPTCCVDGCGCGSAG
jgi:hypothetical protein